MINAKSKARGYRVLLAGGQAVARLGLTVLLGSREGIEVCDHAFAGDEAVRLAKFNQPDLAIVDSSMPGFDTVRAIREASPDTPVLLFHSVLSSSALQDALDAGAAGHISGSDTDCDILTAVRRALEGGAMHSPAANPRSTSKLPAAGLRLVDPESRGWNSLTPREKEILPLLAEGKSNRLIALHFGISFRTVEAHRQHIMLKMKFATITDLIRFAIRAGLIDL